MFLLAVDLTYFIFIAIMVSSLVVIIACIWWIREMNKMKRK